jgi:hypothetical protein
MFNAILLDAYPLVFYKFGKMAKDKQYLLINRSTNFSLTQIYYKLKIKIYTILLGGARWRSG